MKVSDEIHKAYTDIKKSKKYRYIIFHIKDDKEICIETVSVVKLLEGQMETLVLCRVLYYSLVECYFFFSP